MRLLYLIGFLVFGFLAQDNFRDNYIEHKVSQSEGVIVMVKVIGIPNLCGRRNNRILVEFEDRNYSILISSNQCATNTFTVGRTTKLMYVKRFDHMFVEKINSVSYILSFLFFLLPIAFLIMLLKPIKGKP